MNNIKIVKTQVGFRFSSVVFSEDGSVSANLQMGTLTSSSALEGQEPQITFNVLANQGHYISKDEIDAVEFDEDDQVEGATLRAVVESKIEVVLKAKGLLPH